ncbi:MAG TPA: 50S ribosomal protein L29 [Bdellovibrionales bacterium]|nr:50S ribosomal protein L29 [Bdellovibrionales bacterium]
MKFEDIKDLTSSELRKRAVALREELFEARMKHTLGQLGNPIEIRGKRKDMARLKTALQSKLVPSKKSTKGRG